MRKFQVEEVNTFEFSEYEFGLGIPRLTRQEGGHKVARFRATKTKQNGTKVNGCADIVGTIKISAF